MPGGGARTAARVGTRARRGPARRGGVGSCGIGDGRSGAGPEAARAGVPAAPTAARARRPLTRMRLKRLLSLGGSCTVGIAGDAEAAGPRAPFRGGGRRGEPLPSVRCGRRVSSLA